MGGVSTPITVTHSIQPVDPDAAGMSPEGAASEGVELNARLDEFSLDLLLGLLVNSGRSGVLEVAGPRPVLLYFMEGQLSAGESRDDPTLRNSLRRLSPSDPDGGGPTAYSLIEDHLITALAAALIPSDATAQFRPGLPDAELCHYTFRLGAILTAARDRVEAWRVIADVMPSTDVVPRLAADLPPMLDQVLIERHDWQILSTVNGTRSVADIVELAGRSAFETCSSLYRMIVLGAVEV